MKKSEIKALSDISKDIIHMKPNKKAVETLFKQFYKIMRKHGIKYGTKEKGKPGVAISNYEWTMCKALFLSQVAHQMDFYSICLFDSVPKDLQHY